MSQRSPKSFLQSKGGSWRNICMHRDLITPFHFPWHRPSTFWWWWLKCCHCLIPSTLEVQGLLGLQCQQKKYALPITVTQAFFLLPEMIKIWEQVWQFLLMKNDIVAKMLPVLPPVPASPFTNGCCCCAFSACQLFWDTRWTVRTES